MVTQMTTEWIGAMTDMIAALERSEHEILCFDVSDAALEIAAIALPGTAFSFPNAPTVSILVVCCSNDANTVDAGDY